jgi:signal transduction histidine kinase
MNTNKKKSFKPKAHILRLLGEELIKSPVMAIYELIKNSYDADAKVCDVKFQNVENIDEGVIQIEDDGVGIEEEVLENVWLEPGTDHRKPINEEGEREIKRSPIYHRVPVGEKGIGRFAVHKLGDKIKLITRPTKIILNEANEIVSNELLNYELELEIDWKKFSQENYLDDVKVEWIKKEDKEDFYFEDRHGTVILISGLKEVWTRGMSRQLKRSTLSMLSPKADQTNFKIELDFGNNWLADYPDTNEILVQAPYQMTAFLDDSYNFDFEYSYEPLNNADLGSRKIKDNESFNKSVKGEIKPFYRAYLEQKEYDKETIKEKIKEFDDNGIPFGSLMIELYSFDLDSRSLKDTSSTPDLIKKVLKDHAGIRVFKDDLRIYDYGEPGDDWLGLDLKRVQRKEWFSNNQNIGFIYLNSENSSSLVEKTNREGFIHNEVFDHFKIVIDYILTQFKAERLKDSQKWRRYNKKGSTDSVKDELSKFREIINSTDLNNEEKKAALLKEAEKVEKIYEEKQETLLLPAGVGMTASVALHEIDKLVPRMEETVKSTPIQEILIKDQVDELKQYVNGVLSLIKKGGDRPMVINDAINEAIRNYKIKLLDRKIEVEVSTEDQVDKIKCDKRYFVTMLMNIIDNSIYWIDTVYRDFKGILIKTVVRNGFLQIVIADNGPGFKDDIEDIVRPFHTRKEDGIGLGMYLVDTIMMKYGKLMIYNSPADMDEELIPDNYKGAIVELVFNKTEILS